MSNLYHLYVMLDGNTWTRVQSGAPMSYSTAKDAERICQAAGTIARIADDTHPVRFPYSPDPYKS